MSLGREVLVIKIKINKGLSDIISVRERDEPSLVAARFCKKHKLSQKAVNAITFMIDKNLDILIDEELSRLSPKKQPRDLYTQGLTQRAKVQEKIQTIRSSLDAEKQKLFTFKPTLCRQSLDLLKNCGDLTKANTNREIKFEIETPTAVRTQQIDLSATKHNSPIKFANVKNKLGQPEGLINCQSFSFQSKPLSVYQSFKDFSNNKLKTLFRNK